MARGDALYWVDVHLSGVGQDLLGASASVERAEDAGLAERLLTNPFSATIPLLAARLINNGAKGALGVTSWFTGGRLVSGRNESCDTI